MILAVAPLKFLPIMHQTSRLYYMSVKLSYKIIARTNPPTIASPPVATFATAALVVDVGAALDDDVLVEVTLAVRLETLGVRVVARVPFEAAEDVDKMVGVGDADELVDTAVLVLDATDELLVNPVPVANWTVVVVDAEPVAEEPLEEAEPPVMWNGNENWKVEGSESRVI